MKQIKLYSTQTCPWCHKAKAFLKKKKIEFQSIGLSADKEGRDEMIEKSNQMGVPVLDINGAIIVGFDQAAIEKALG